MCTKFNIEDVARIHGIQLLKPIKNGEAFAVCPFCGNTKGKFSYVIQKGNKENYYNCFSCGAHGGAISLHIALSNEDYSGADGKKRAARDIFQAINGNTSFEENHKKVSENMEYTDEAEKLSDEKISKVYYALLKELKLKDKHKADLLKRGLTEKDVERYRFKSTPDGDERFAVCRRLIRQGLSLEGVPGFYINRRGSWDMKIPGSGYLCPVFDGEKNLIIGFQIRVDEPKDGGKYLWFSSSGKQKGCSSGAVPTLLPGKCSDKVIITEGILKATVVYSLLKGEISVIGVPGVKSIKGIDDYLSRFDTARTLIFESYDMDKAMKSKDEHEKQKTERLAEDTRKLLQKIEELGFMSHSLKWDYDKDGLWKGTFKGLDDFLLDYKDRDVFVRYLSKKQEERCKIVKYFAS
jgi:hypothetical protein